MRIMHKVAVSAMVLLAVGGASTAAAAAVLQEDNADGPSSLVEDFAYPGADQIHDVKLISGDGHIVYADCATTPVDGIGVLKVYTSRDLGGTVCFKILADRGLLNLELPQVFEIRGDGQNSESGHEVTATVVPDGEPAVTVEVDPNGSTQVGKGVNENDPDTTLLKLEVTGQI